MFENSSITLLPNVPQSVDYDPVKLAFVLFWTQGGHCLPPISDDVKVCGASLLRQRKILPADWKGKF